MNWIQCVCSLLLISSLRASPDTVIVSVNPKKVAHVLDDHFVSLTINPTDLLTGRPFGVGWNTTANLLRGLSPAYVRLGGPDTGNYLFRQDDTPFNSKSEEVAVTDTNWKNINEMMNKAGLDIIACLNNGQRTGEAWDSRNALDFISFSDKENLNVTWEFGYEIAKKGGFSGMQIGNDIIQLREILNGYPRYRSSRLIGPDIRSIHRKEDFDHNLDILDEAGSVLDAITWHPRWPRLGTINPLDTTEDDYKFPSDYLEWDKHQFQKMLMQRPLLKKPLWISEPRGENKGTFAEGLIWARRLALAAKLGIDVVMKQPFLNDISHPKPEYWIGLLHKKTLGRVLLDSRSLTNQSDVFLTTQCTSKRYPKGGVGGVTIYMVNTGGSQHRILIRGIASSDEEEEVHQYILTSGGNEDSIFSQTTYLNGQPLVLSKDGELPELVPKIKHLRYQLVVRLPPYSVGLWVIPFAKIHNCEREPLSQSHTLFDDLAISEALNTAQKGLNNLRNINNFIVDKILIAPTLADIPPSSKIEDKENSISNEEILNDIRRKTRNPDIELIGQELKTKMDELLKLFENKTCLQRVRSVDSSNRLASAEEKIDSLAVDLRKFVGNSNQEREFGKFLEAAGLNKDFGKLMMNDRLSRSSPNLQGTEEDDKNFQDSRIKRENKHADKHAELEKIHHDIATLRSLVHPRPKSLENHKENHQTPDLNINRIKTELQEDLLLREIALLEKTEESLNEAIKNHKKTHHEMDKRMRDNIVSVKDEKIAALLEMKYKDSNYADNDHVHEKRELFQGKPDITWLKNKKREAAMDEKASTLDSDSSEEDGKKVEPIEEFRRYLHGLTLKHGPHSDIHKKIDEMKNSKLKYWNLLGSSGSPENTISSPHDNLKSLLQADDNYLSNKHTKAIGSNNGEKNKVAKTTSDHINNMGFESEEFEDSKNSNKRSSRTVGKVHGAPLNYKQSPFPPKLLKNGLTEQENESINRKGSDSPGGSAGSSEQTAKQQSSDESWESESYEYSTDERNKESSISSTPKSRIQRRAHYVNAINSEDGPKNRGGKSSFRKDKTQFASKTPGKEHAFKRLDETTNTKPSSEIQYVTQQSASGNEKTVEAESRNASSLFKASSSEPAPSSPGSFLSSSSSPSTESTSETSAQITNHREGRYRRNANVAKNGRSNNASGHTKDSSNGGDVNKNTIVKIKQTKKDDDLNSKEIITLAGSTVKAVLDDVVPEVYDQAVVKLEHLVKPEYLANLAHIVGDLKVFEGVLKQISESAASPSNENSKYIQKIARKKREVDEIGNHLADIEHKELLENMGDDSHEKDDQDTPILNNHHELLEDEAIQRQVAVNDADTLLTDSVIREILDDISNEAVEKELSEVLNNSKSNNERKKEETNFQGVPKNIKDQSTDIENEDPSTPWKTSSRDILEHVISNLMQRQVELQAASNKGKRQVSNHALHPQSALKGTYPLPQTETINQLLQQLRPGVYVVPTSEMSNIRADQSSAGIVPSGFGKPKPNVMTFNIYYDKKNPNEEAKSNSLVADYKPPLVAMPSRTLQFNGWPDSQQLPQLATPPTPLPALASLPQLTSLYSQRKQYQSPHSPLIQRPQSYPMNPSAAYSTFTQNQPKYDESFTLVSQEPKLDEFKIMPISTFTPLSSQNGNNLNWDPENGNKIEQAEIIQAPQSAQAKDVNENKSWYLRKSIDEPSVYIRKEIPRTSSKIGSKNTLSDLISKKSPIEPYWNRTLKEIFQETANEPFWDFLKASEASYSNYKSEEDDLSRFISAETTGNNMANSGSNDKSSLNRQKRSLVDNSILKNPRQVSETLPGNIELPDSISTNSLYEEWQSYQPSNVDTFADVKKIPELESTRFVGNPNDMSGNQINKISSRRMPLDSSRVSHGILPKSLFHKPKEHNSLEEGSEIYNIHVDLPATALSGNPSIITSEFENKDVLGFSNNSPNLSVADESPLRQFYNFAIQVIKGMSSYV